MELYIYVYISLFILAILEIFFSKNKMAIDSTNTKSTLQIPIILSIIFIVLYYILALRMFTGTDTYVYYRMFNISSLQTDIEEGFVHLIGIVQSFGGDFFDFEKIVAIITLIPIALAIYLFSPFPWYSSLLFFSIGSYFALFNTMRQGIALSLTFCALSLLIFSKKNIYLRWVIAASLIILATKFHTTAFFVIPIAILIMVLKKLFLRHLKTVWALDLLLFVIFVMKIDFLQAFFRLITSLNLGSFSTKYLSLYAGTNYLSNNSSGVMIINFILILILFAINFSRIKNNATALNVAAILGVYLILLSTRNGAQLYTRIIYYLDILLVLIFPMILKDSLKYKKYIYITIFIQFVYILFNFLRMIVLNYNGIIPYGNTY